jgi:hypothetical protein
LANLLKETSEERESRVLLIRFLSLTDRLLERVLGRIIEGQHQLVARIESLRIIWTSARENLKGIIESLHIGLNNARRKALNAVGMFGSALKAKFDLLSFDVQEGAVGRVLKRLNSILGSLAEIFLGIDAVKEFKDHLEATIDGLKNPSEFITLKDLLEQK